jgi:cytochrome c-type biogenesis protein CcmH
VAEAPAGAATATGPAAALGGAPVSGAPVAGGAAGRPAGGGAAPGERRPRPWLGLTVLLVVLAVALAVGGGLGSSPHRTAAQRAAALDGDLRCPSCDDLSVAQSSASAAVAVRHEVLHLAREGRTDQQIDDALVAQYGPSILLRPPDRGLAGLVWIIPVVAGALAVAALGVLFWRRGWQMARLRQEASLGAEAQPGQEAELRGRAG